MTTQLLRVLIVGALAVGLGLGVIAMAQGLADLAQHLRMIP